MKDDGATAVEAGAGAGAVAATAAGAVAVGSVGGGGVALGRVNEYVDVSALDDGTSHAPGVAEVPAVAVVVVVSVVVALHWCVVVVVVVRLCQHIDLKMVGRGPGHFEANGLSGLE